MQSKSVPLAALCFAGDVDISSNGEHAKTAPVKIIARTKHPVLHPYWGNTVHDNSGMRLTQGKSRVPVDYNHNRTEIIGYANKFALVDGDLVASGALTPFRSDDRASEVLYKAGEGVPYESSIFFDPANLVLEEVPAGASVPVNGVEFAGPGIIFREWTLRGLAICPYGQDGNTTVEFSNANTVTVKFVAAGNTQMSTSVEAVESIGDAVAVAVEGAVEQIQAAVVEAVEAAVVVVEVEAGTDVEAGDEVDSELQEDSEEKTTSAESVETAKTELSLGQRFLSEFGAQGGVWFAEGKSIVEARGLFTQSLLAENELFRKEIAELRAKLGQGCGESAVSFSLQMEPEKKAIPNLSPGLAKFAAGIVVPKK